MVLSRSSINIYGRNGERERGKEGRSQAEKVSCLPKLTFFLHGVGYYCDVLHSLLHNWLHSGDTLSPVKWEWRGEGPHWGEASEKPLPASVLLDGNSILVDFTATRQSLGPGVPASCRAVCHQEGGRTVCPEQAGARLGVQAPGLAFRGT